MISFAYGNIILTVTHSNILTNMITPVKSVNKEPCFSEKERLSIEIVVVKVAGIVIDDGIWS